MNISKKLDIRLKAGNLALALLLSTVPTLMTIAFLNVHGLIVCESFSRRYLDKSSEIKEICQKSNLDVSTSYVIWIWLIITLPTWRWFYIGHLKRAKVANK